MKKVSVFGEPISAKIKYTKVNQKFKLDKLELINFFKELSIIIQSGLPLINSIDSIINSVNNRNFKLVLSEISDSLNSGNSLSQALSLYPNIFGSLIINMIVIGEKNGDLANSCKVIVFLEEEVLNISDKIKKSVRYPILVFSVFIIAFIAIVVLVLPQFNEIFQSYNKELPEITVSILNISSFITQNVEIIIMVILLIYILCRLIFFNKLKYIFDFIKIQIPFLAKIFYYFEMYKFFISFKLLFSSGVKIDESITYSTNSISNYYFKSKLSRLKTDIVSSKSLSYAFINLGFIDDLTLRLIVIGEQSGDFDTVLNNITDMMKYKLDKQIDDFTFLLENSMIFIISALVLFLALIIFLPLWNLNSIISF
jgi:general secretion pathway protein F